MCVERFKKLGLDFLNTSLSFVPPCSQCHVTCQDEAGFSLQCLSSAPPHDFKLFPTTTTTTTPLDTPVSLDSVFVLPLYRREEPLTWELSQLESDSHGAVV